MWMLTAIKKYKQENIHAAPLATIRIVFGGLMFFGIVRFWAKGWIEKLYLEPTFHFQYFGFEFVQVPSPILTYLLFTICGMAALSFALGFQYRLSIVMFFLSFSYIELMDKTTYLNHYYFISVLSFILIWIPAHRYFSIDAYRKPKLASEYIPRWTVDVLKILLVLVYLYAGAAKLNYDWLIRAMPLSIWLSAKAHIPLLGGFLQEKWVHYAFSWGGALYDLTIAFFLLYRKTRWPAFIMVIIFHVLTAILFPIGMFPYIMISGTLIFFSPDFHYKLLNSLQKLNINTQFFDNGKNMSSGVFSRVGLIIVSLVIVVQLVFPLRFLAYTGNIFWTEHGYRFSWRVMLMEKTGYAQFKVVDKTTGKQCHVQNDEFLCALQEKHMVTQPDFILQFAHFLGEEYKKRGFEDAEVYVESYAALNGRFHQPYIKHDVDLLKIKNNLSTRNYIVPLND